MKGAHLILASPSRIPRLLFSLSLLSMTLCSTSTVVKKSIYPMWNIIDVVRHRGWQLSSVVICYGLISESVFSLATVIPGCCVGENLYWNSHFWGDRSLQELSVLPFTYFRIAPQATMKQLWVAIKSILKIRS